MCSIINRFEVEDTHLEQPQSLAQEYNCANALLFPTSVNPTIWAIGHIVPAHARQVYDKYGQGLLTVTMEGREAKHIALLKLSAKLTLPTNIDGLKYSGMNLLCWFGYLNNIMNLAPTLVVKRFTFLKGVFKDSNYCYCGLHKADPTDKSCCLCSDHLMTLTNKSVKLS